MNELVCVTLVGRLDEAEKLFQGRLSTFWTHMLRNFPDDYEQIYAEASRAGTCEGRITRQYMVAVDGLETLTTELAGAGIDHEPIDADDTYTKYEAVSPDWFQIDH